MLFVLVIIVAMNLLDAFNVVNLDGLANRINSPRVINLFLPSQNFKHNRDNASNAAITGVESFNAAGSNSTDAFPSDGFADVEDFEPEQEFDEEADPEGDAFDDADFEDEAPEAEAPANSVG